MEYEDNFCEFSLLLKQPVHFIARNEKKIIENEWEMRLPTVKDIYIDTRFRSFISLLHTPIEDIRQQFSFIKDLDNHFQLIITLIKFDIQITIYYVQDILYSLQLLNIPATIENGNLYINKEQITYSLFNRIVEIIMVAAGAKKMSEIQLDPAMQAMQNKIDRIKKKGRKVGKNETEHSGDIKDMFMSLTYEFGYSIDEILTMNMYLINTLLSYVGKSINYKVSLIAAGNGLTKKVKYITK